MRRYMADNAVMTQENVTHCGSEALKGLDPVTFLCDSSSPVDGYRVRQPLTIREINRVTHHSSWCGNSTAAPPPGDSRTP